MFNNRTSPINSFRGVYAFCSNFYPIKMDVTLVDGKTVTVPTLEHAFQILKTCNIEHQMAIAMCKTPSEAKKLGRRTQLRSDWNSVKIQIMTALVRKKFQDPILQSQLVNTGNAYLIEDNQWNDKFWGMCNNVGENYLGRILMQIRKELNFKF